MTDLHHHVVGDSPAGYGPLRSFDAAATVYEADPRFTAEAWDAFSAATPAEHEDLVLDWYRSSDRYHTCVCDVMEGLR